MIKKCLQIEYALAFFITLGLYIQSGFSIWLFVLFLLLPDLTMLGYLVNPVYGSIFYNIGHSLALPLLVVTSALIFSSELLLMTSLIWLAHIFLDRFLGYGLKYKEGFKITHMQKI